MKKLVSLSTLLATLLYADAQNNKLDQIVVLGTKTESNISDLPAHVEVITQEQIQNSGYTTTADILANSVTIQTSPDGSSVRLRGMAHNETLLLIDGRRVIGEYEKKYELERIPAGMIERIEILKGSGSVLYGSEAMGGVINIITKKPTQKLTGEGSAVVYSDRIATDIFLAGALGATNYKLFANYLNRNAYDLQREINPKVMQAGEAKDPQNLTGGGGFGALRSDLASSYEIQREFLASLELVNVGAALSHKLNESFEMGADMGYLEEKKDALFVSNSYASNYKLPNTNPIMAREIPADEQNRNKRLTLGAYAKANPLENLTILYDFAHASYDKERFIYTPLYSELGYTSIDASLSGENVATLTSNIHNLLTTYTLNAENKLSFGAEHRERKNSSNALNTSRNNEALFAQHEYKPLEPLRVVYGARYDKDSLGESLWSGSLGANYALTQKLKLKTNYAQGFTTPDDRDLFVTQMTPNGRPMYGSTIITGDKTEAWQLKSQKSETIEAGLTYLTDYFKFDTTLYKTDVRDKIQRDIKPTYQTFINLDSVSIEGFESSLEFYYEEDFTARLYYMALDARDNLDNSELLFTPTEATGLSMSYFFKKNIEFRTITKHTSEQLNEERQRVPSYMITNLKVIATDLYKNFDLFCGVDNLFGETIDDTLGAIPQVNYYAGAKYRF